MLHEDILGNRLITFCYIILVHFRISEEVFWVHEREAETDVLEEWGKYNIAGNKSLSTIRKIVRSLLRIGLRSTWVARNQLKMSPDLPIPGKISLREFLTIVVLFFFAIWTVMWYTRNWRRRRSRLLKLAKCLPGPSTLPMVGNALRFACKPEQLLERVVGVIVPYEDVTPMRVWMGPSLYVIVTSPRDIEVVLNGHQATNKGMAYKFLFPFIGDGLISGSGKDWRSHRKIVAHTLNPRTLRDYVNIFDKRSRILMEKLMIFADGQVFDILEPIEGCTIDIVCEAVMGYTDINAQENPNQEFIQHTAEMYKIVHDRMMKIWLHPECIFHLTWHYRKQCKAQKIIRDFTEKCIAAKKKELSDPKNSEKERASILERILEINKVTHELTDEELRDEIYTVYIAAQDTLALTSSFASLMLAMHVDVQERAREEVQDVLGNDESITFESLNRMKYLEMCVKETLRLFPIAPLMVRRLGDELPLDTCTLPESCQVVIASYVTHRSKKYWKNPDQFVPERFSIEECGKRHPYAFIPFSGGPMGCIGQKFALMSLKTIVANLLRSYKITTNVRMQDVKLKTDISIRSIDGYKVSLKSLHEEK